MNRLGLAAALLACVVVGPASSARTPAPAKYGGTLFVGLSLGDPNSLDPTVGQSNSSQTVYQAICQRLYDYDARQQLVPLLAAAVPVLSKDKLSYTVQLRQGIKFNDGTPFNAQAVVTSIQRFMTYPGSARASDYDGVNSVSASGPYTVVFHLKGRDSSFVGSNPFVLSPTAMASEGDNFAAKPVCVGPFMFDHRVVGDNVTVVKSPYYYDQPHVYLDKIVYKPMPDPAAAAAALKAGDIQALIRVSTTELQALRQNSNLRVIQQGALSWTGIFFNIGNRNGIGNLPYTPLSTPFASSAKLRQAFEEAIDRNTFNKVVFDGLYQPSCTLVAAANTAWYDATKVPCTPYDPKDARKLVAASGFSNPTVHLLALTGDGLRQAEFIQAQEAAVGINVVIDPTDSVTYLSRAAAGNFDTWLFGSGVNTADPSEATNKLFATSGVGNRSGYSNPRLDLILSNGLKATSEKARSTLYHVAQQIITADRPAIPLYNSVVFAAFSANVTGVQFASSSIIKVANARYK